MSEPKKPSNVLLRVGSAVLALAVVLPLLFFGGAPGVLALTGLVLVWSQLEYTRMTFPTRARAILPLLVGLGGVMVLAVQTQDFRWLAASALLGLFVTAWWVLFTPRADTTGMQGEWGRLLLGVFYIPLPLGFLPLVVAMPDGHGFGWLVLTFAATWGGDSGAYFAGRTFGRTPLFPLVSPKKTWEGFAGGLVAAVGLCCLLKVLFFPWVGWVDCVVLGVMLDLAGVTGDLVESMIKRDVGVKDSGTFLPGHGGMLDRIDSIVFTLPLTWIYVRGIYG